MEIKKQYDIKNLIKCLYDIINNTECVYRKVSVDIITLQQIMDVLTEVERHEVVENISPKNVAELCGYKPPIGYTIPCAKVVKANCDNEFDPCPGEFDSNMKCCLDGIMNDESCKDCYKAPYEEKSECFLKYTEEEAEARRCKECFYKGRCKRESQKE